MSQQRVEIFQIKLMQMQLLQRAPGREGLPGHGRLSACHRALIALELLFSVWLSRGLVLDQLHHPWSGLGQMQDDPS